MDGDRRGLEPRDGDYVLPKKRYGAFSGNDLAFLLKNLRVETLVIAGVETEICVLATAYHAFNEDYRVVVPSDGVAALDPELGDAALRIIEREVGWVSTCDEIGSGSARRCGMSEPIAPYMAVGLSTIVHGIGARRDIERNLDTIEDGIHAAVSIVGINMPVKLIALAEGALDRFTDEIFDVPHVTAARRAFHRRARAETDRLAALARLYETYLVGAVQSALARGDRRTGTSTS